MLQLPFIHVSRTRTETVRKYPNNIFQKVGASAVLLQIRDFDFRKFISVTSLEVKSRLGPRGQQRHRVRDTVLGSQGDEVSAVQPRTRHSSWI